MLNTNERSRTDTYTRPVARSCGANGRSGTSLRVARVACTYNSAMRVSGTMEFRHPHRAVIPQRVEAIVASAGPLLDGVRWDERSNVWVGAHPVTRIPMPDLGMKATIGVIFATPDKTPQDISEVAAAGDAYIDDYLIAVGNPSGPTGPADG